MVKDFLDSNDFKATLIQQDEQLGTGHAIGLAEEFVNGEEFIALGGDNLWSVQDLKDMQISDEYCYISAIETKTPEKYGVLVTQDDFLEKVVEKPKEYISDLAIIGIYYFRDGDKLKAELQYLIDNDIKKGKEFQLTDALENMKNKDVQLYPGTVQEWLDCGNKDATVYTNQRILEFKNDQVVVRETLENNDSTILEPCWIGNDVRLENATIGPHVSVGDNTIIQNSVIQNCIIQSNCVILNAKLTNSMIGNFVEYEGSGNQQQVSVGDYSSIKKDD